MKPKPKKESLNELMALALASLKPTVDVVPAGWLTVHQWASGQGVGVMVMHRSLVRLIAEKKAERRMFKIQLKKYARPVPHYRLIPEAIHHTAD